MSDQPVDPLAVAKAEPDRTLIALDFDGTLAPIVSRPEVAYAHPEAVGVLAELADAGFRLAIVTGRPVDDVLRLGAGFAEIADLVICGHYGLERWAGGTLTAPPEHPGVRHACAALDGLVASAADGVHLEDKGRSVAVHTRNATDADTALADVEPDVRTVAQRAGLEVVPGKYVLELRPPGMDKGEALRELTAELAARAVVFAGDDRGDMPAVAALRSMDVAGFVVCGDSPETPAELRDAADLVVDGPAGVLTFLRTSLLP